MDVGEKGIASDMASAVIGDGASLVERTTTQVTSSVIGITQDTADSIRSKVIEAAADNTIEEARLRLRKEPPAESDH